MFSEAKAEAKRRVEDGKKISTKQQVCVCGVCVRRRRLMCALLLCPLGGAAR